MRDNDTDVPRDPHDGEGVHSRLPNSSKHCMSRGVQDEISAEDRTAFAIDFRGRDLAVEVIGQVIQVSLSPLSKRPQSAHRRALFR